jgi:hypothetical protein
VVMRTGGGSSCRSRRPILPSDARVAGRPSRQANPDKAQRAVRAKALAAGKLLDMAVPRLADDLPFYLLDPEDLRGSPWEAASQGGRCQGRPEGRGHPVAPGRPGARGPSGTTLRARRPGPTYRKLSSLSLSSSFTWFPGPGGGTRPARPPPARRRPRGGSSPPTRRCCPGEVDPCAPWATGCVPTAEDP